MRELVGFAEAQPYEDVVAFGETLDAAPQFKLVEVWEGRLQGDVGQLEPEPEWRAKYLSSTLRVKPITCSSYTVSSILLSSI